MAAAGVDATVDNHSVWIKEIVRAGQAARLAALGVFVLLFSATAAVIVFATRSALEARRELVEVLHLSGAEDGFIAGLFQRRFAGMAAMAGLMGGAAALLAGAGYRLVSGNIGITPILPVAWIDLLAPLPCPLIAGAIAMFAARATALRLLSALA